MKNIKIENSEVIVLMAKKIEFITGLPCFVNFVDNSIDEFAEVFVLNHIEASPIFSENKIHKIVNKYELIYMGTSQESRFLHSQKMTIFLNKAPNIDFDEEEMIYSLSWTIDKNDIMAQTEFDNIWYQENELS